MKVVKFETSQLLEGFFSCFQIYKLSQSALPAFKNFKAGKIIEKNEVMVLCDALIVPAFSLPDFLIRLFYVPQVPQRA